MAAARQRLRHAGGVEDGGAGAQREHHLAEVEQAAVDPFALRELADDRGQRGNSQRATKGRHQEDGEGEGPRCGEVAPLAVAEPGDRPQLGHDEEAAEGDEGGPVLPHEPVDWSGQDRADQQRQSERCDRPYVGG